MELESLCKTSWGWLPLIFPFSLRQKLYLYIIFIYDWKIYSWFIISIFKFQSNKIIIHHTIQGRVGLRVIKFIVHRVGRTLCLQTFFELVHSQLWVLVLVLKPHKMKFIPYGGWNFLGHRNELPVQTWGGGFLHGTSEPLQQAWEETRAEGRGAEPEGPWWGALSWPSLSLCSPMGFQSEEQGLPYRSSRNFLLVGPSTGPKRSQDGQELQVLN